MKSPDITDGARNHLESLRHRVEQAAGADWQRLCLEQLEDVTGLKLVDFVCCENAFRSVIFGPKFSFPTRKISELSRGLARNDSVESVQHLVDYYFKWLPNEKGEDEKGVLDVLGTYWMESDVVGAHVELYWAKIAAFSHRRNFEIEQVAKVVMLHELAHFVTHQGCGSDREYWNLFPSGKEVVELVAQMATEDVLIKFNHAALLKVFDELLKDQSRAYTGHREVRECFGKIPGEIRTRLLKEFWTLFRDVIQKQGETLQSVDSVLTKIKNKEILETATVNTGIVMDI